MKKFLLILTCFVATAISSAQTAGQASSWPNDEMSDIKINEDIKLNDDSANVDEMTRELNTPAVGQKHKKYVSTYMNQVALKFYREKMDVEVSRGGEVVIVTVQTDSLFVPNEATLTDRASTLLTKFTPYIRDPKHYKILFAVHSDDTGSEEYLFNLTEGRVNAILDFYESIYVPTNDIIGFPKGGSEPLDSNDTRAGRAANRRLEVYIVPEQGLIDEAKGKK